MYVIHLLRKPLGESSIVRNCKVYGTGGLDIDNARVGSRKRVPASVSRALGGASLSGSLDCSLRKETGRENGHDPNVGRFPADILLAHKPDCLKASCLDGCPIIKLDRKLPGASSYFKQVQEAPNEPTQVQTVRVSGGA